MTDQRLNESIKKKNSICALLFTRVLLLPAFRNQNLFGMCESSKGTRAVFILKPCLFDEDCGRATSHAVRSSML